MNSQQEQKLSAAMLSFEREQVKRGKRPELPIDRAPDRPLPPLNEQQLDVIRELRRSGPATSVELSRRLPYSSHQIVNYLKGRAALAIVKKTERTQRLETIKQNSAWIYEVRDGS